MAVRIPNALPAKKILESENIFVIGENQKSEFNTRPVRVLILNMMPFKDVTETHFLRMLSNTPLCVDIEFLMIASHNHKNTPKEYLAAFYKTFDEIKDCRFDGMIITGAPLELIEFEEVTYWDELCKILDWSKKNVTSTLHICWGAQAGLYRHYGINKYELPRKMSGVFKHKVHLPTEPLMRGFNDVFDAPHSRYTGIKAHDVKQVDGLTILSESDEAGVNIVVSNDRKQIFVTGHPEYDDNTLNEEYWRDVNRGLDIHIPCNYYPNDNPHEKPVVTWRSHSHLLYSNWLNYYVCKEN